MSEIPGIKKMQCLTIATLRLRSTTRNLLFIAVGTFLSSLSCTCLPISVMAQEVAPAPPPVQETTIATEPEDPTVVKALEDLLKSMELGDFTYQVEDRPDPFMPFISTKVSQPEEGSETGEGLTGMRQLEPGQLSLVAIIFTENNPMAMVEDSSHRGYSIHRGTKIGKSSIVADILPNAVIIKQLSYSMNQEKKYSTVEMILRKEGEK